MYNDYVRVISTTLSDVPIELCFDKDDIVMQVCDGSVIKQQPANFRYGGQREVSLIFFSEYKHNEV